MHCVRWRTRRSRARNTTPFACCSSLFTGTKRMLGRWAASQIASASAMSFCIRPVVLLPLHVRLDVGRRDQAHGVAQLAELTRPVMRPGAGLHRHRAGRLGGEEFEHLRPHQALAEHHTAGRVCPVRLENPLRNVQSDCVNLSHGRLLKWSIDTTLARRCRPGASTPSQPRIDLIVLDLMLPGEDGLSLCRRLRATSTIPIVMLTAKSEEIDRIIGLEMGADDYLPKPFNPRELLARIRSVLRRRRAEPASAAGPAGQVLSFAGWQAHLTLRELVNPAGAKVALTGAEFDLLHAFCERSGRVLSRDQLLDLTQGRVVGPFERSIDVLVSRLRHKIERDPREPEFIKTIRSSGYVFTPSVERS